MQLQFGCQAYQAASPALDDQQCINMFVERSPEDAKSKVPVFGCAGLTLFATCGSAPILGAHIFNSVAYFVTGTNLYSVASDGTVTNLGSITLVGPASMADNGVQLCIVDGATGWIYQPAGIGAITTETMESGATAVTATVTGTIHNGDTLNIPLDAGGTFTTTADGTYTAGSATIAFNSACPSQVTSGAVMVDPSNTLAQITAAAFYPAKTVTFFDGFFVFDRAGTNEFFISNIYDGTTYNALYFASAESDPDPVVATVMLHEQLLIFGTQTVEFWYDAGNPDFPYQRFDGAYLHRGTYAPLSVHKEDNTVFWLGDDGIFYRLNGLVPQRISTFAMEYAWSQYSTTTDCVVFSYTQRGHKFIVVTFPSGPATWVYDISSQLWHERISWNSSGASLSRWRGSCALDIYGQTLIGDAFNGSIGTSDYANYTEYGNQIQGLVTSPPVQADRQRVFMPRFELDVQAGVGNTAAPNPMIYLDFTDDNGNTFSTPAVGRAMGEAGAYTTRLRWLRLGQSRQRTLRLTVTDPVLRVFLGFYLDIHKGMGGS